TSIPYTREIVNDHPVLTLVSSDYNDIINKINTIYAETNLRKSLYGKIKRYITLHSYERLSLDLLEIYRGLAA
ncbi:MAG: hypothetical protein PVI26_07925, partial [Chitinispirillia bacterium]